MGRKKISTDFNPVVALEIGKEFPGVYLETKVVQVDGEDRTIHTFGVDKAQSPETGAVEVWGSAMLNMALKQIKTGKTVYIMRGADVDSPTVKNSKMKTFSVEVDE